MIVERSVVVEATPQTIWGTCFEDMQWQKWVSTVLLPFESYSTIRTSLPATPGLQQKKDKRRNPCCSGTHHYDNLIPFLLSLIPIHSPINYILNLQDIDITGLENVSGGCVNGTTFTFVMKDGPNVNLKLSQVVQFKTLTFNGKVFGIAKARGKVVITPIDSTKTTIDDSFDFYGCIGSIIGWLNKAKTVKGAEGSLANMKKLSEEAQKKV